MIEFEYLSALISVLLGMGMTQLLSSVNKLRGRVRMYRLTLA